MKIALGTAQWGLKYGISNKSEIPNDSVLKRILKIAKSAGIDLLDTAPSYGNSENRIGQLSLNQFNIVTKIDTSESKGLINNQVRDSIKALNQERLYGVLFHNADSLIKNKTLWDELNQNKQEGKINKIGYSLYEPEQLDRLLDLEMIPDLVQFPYNVLDRKFESYFTFLKERGIEIHIRSIFLQGLLFKKGSELPEKLKLLKPAIDRLQSLSEKFNQSILNICLGYVLQKELIDYCIVGIDNENQLREIINTNKFYPKELIYEIEKIKVYQKECLNPSKW